MLNYRNLLNKPSRIRETWVLVHNYRDPNPR